MDYFVIAMQLMLSLSILIVLHELGHFIPAKLFKTRVEKFYLFFNPKFSLFKFKKGETEYGIGWLPLGGYVKISGMVDETETLTRKDKDGNEVEEEPSEPQPWEFRTKPAWQRLIIMIGGIVVNLIVGFVIYACVLWAWGEEYIAAEDAKYGVSIGMEEMKAPGLFQEGDKVLTIGGEPLETLHEASSRIIIDGERDVVVERNGHEVAFSLPADIEQTVLKNNYKGPLLMEAFPTVIDSVTPNGEAHKIGLLKGDSIVGVDLKEINNYYQFRSYVTKNCQSKRTIITYYRDGEKKNIVANLPKTGTLGFYTVSDENFLTYSVKEYGFFEAIPEGYNRAIGTLTKYVKSMRLLFTKEGAKKVGGFGSMAKLFPTTWDWKIFWLNTALISIILAFMNFLPIPALDGGYILFLLFEMITGIRPSDQFMEKANTVGFLFLILLLVYANGNDAFGWFD